MNQDHLEALFEHITSQNQAVLEAVGDMQEKINNLPTRDEFNQLRADVAMIKHAVKATNHDLQMHTHDRLSGKVKFASA